MTARFTLMLISVCIAGAAFSDEPETPASNSVKEISSALRNQWSGRGNRDACCLQCDASWDDQVSGPPSVILIPGMMANPSSMSLVREGLKKAKIPVAAYQYSNHLSIEAAGVELRNELTRLSSRDSRRDLVLVTHSMGGLVARVALEQGRVGETNVKRLIMIAPPNHGSALAELSAKEIAALFSDSKPAEESMQVIDDAVSGFLGEAQADLRPGSRLLLALNQRPRADSVEYCIIAGTKAPLQSEVVDMSLALASLLLGDDAESMPLLRSAQRLSRVDEWTSGRGDGVVSVESTKLDGVSDFVRLPFAHTDFGVPDGGIDANEGAMAAVKEIVERVTAAKPSTASVN